MNIEIADLLDKYDVPTPRYTSYPTVPYWDLKTINQQIWERSVLDTFKTEQGELCIYVHLPFCENLCTFCACNKRITRNHQVEDPYISAVLKEWDMYKALLPSIPIIKEIHLGGGTPTFFNPENLVRLIDGLKSGAAISNAHEFSVEVHPNYTTEDHIEQLSFVGFNRISLGIQDFDPIVQFAINRIQSFEKTKEVVDWARKYHYQSVNVDLIYGLPHQTVDCIEHSVNLVKALSPDRIAFYSYAHVPWKSKSQRRYTESDLPIASEKWAMYNCGRKLLEEAGFETIGMDHFALPGDKLFTAAANGSLNRNFMGYTTTKSKLVIGLGASSISDSWGAFVQNEKVVETYEEKIAAGFLPLTNGHLLNDEDTIIRQHILELMCENRTVLEERLLDAFFIESAFLKLAQLQDDGLVSLARPGITVTPIGRSFIRNIIATIDVRLWRAGRSAATFSQAI
ncbi:MAG: oxygen-independent coproporphyrinogen III oxidase [Mucilaginibacter sp.]